MNKAVVSGTKDSGSSPANVMLFAMLHLCAEVLGCTASWFNASLPDWLRGWTQDPMQVTARGFAPHSWHNCCCPVGVCYFRAVGAACRAQRCYSLVVGSQVCKLDVLCTPRRGACYVVRCAVPKSFLVSLVLWRALFGTGGMAQR